MKDAKPKTPSPRDVPRSRWLEYTFAAATVTAATLVRLALDPFLGDTYPFIIYFGAVTMVAWYGRTPTAIFTLVLSGLLAAYLVVPPRFAFAPAEPKVVLGLGLYLIVSAVVVAMSHAMRVARRRAEQALAEAVLLQEELRQAVTAEAEQREQLRTTLASIGDAVITTDTRGRVTHLNRVAETLTGWTNNEAINQPLDKVFRIVHEATRQPVENPAARALRDGEIVGLANHTILIGKDTTERPIDDSAAPIRSAIGEIVGCVLVFRDITERHRHELRLRASEARLRELADAMPQIVYEADALGRVVFVNRQWLDYTGQGEAQTADLSSMVHPDDLGEMIRRWDTARATGTILQAEFRLRRAADSAYRWFLTRSVPIRDEAGQVIKWFGTSTDIDEHKQTAQRLAESEVLYRAIGESIDFGVWVCDAEGRNTYASDSFLAMVGISQQQCSDLGWGDVLHPDDVDATIAAWKECVRTQGMWDREHRFRGIDGEWHHVLARGVPRRNAVGEAIGWAGINLDITRLVRTERDIARLAAESERQRRLYETILSNTPDFVYVFSLDHRVLYANDALIKMWGRGHAGAIGKTFLEIGYEPWHADMHDREIDQVRKTRQPVRGEVPFTGTNGRRLYDYIFVPIIGADGEVEAVAGTTRDVTEQKEAEAAVRASEARHTFLVKLADTLRPLSDPADVQAEASRVLGEHLGANRVLYFEIRGDDYVIERDYTSGVRPLAGRYPVASFGPTLLAALLAGRTVIEADATTEPDREPSERAAFAAIQLRGHVDVPLVKGGRFVAGLTVHVSDRRDWTSLEVAVIEETAERTWAAVERARAEAAMRQSEERRRLALDAAELGAWQIDLSTNAFTTDERFSIIFTGNVESMPYEQSIVAIHPEDRERILEAVAAATRPDNPAPYSEEYRVVHPDGQVRWIFAKGRAHADRKGAGRLTSFDGTIADVTARKLAEAERDRLVKRLREEERRKDEFLATLAHELRNPLAPIRSGLEILRMGGASRTVEQVSSMMERQLGQMTRLVDDLLDVSRVTSGKLQLRKQRIELRGVIEAAVETSGPTLDQAGHDLAVLVPGDPIFVDGDAVRLAQAVSNLLTNSAKYTRQGGQVRVSLTRDEATAVVTVADSGIGIPTGMLEAVFGMFTQVDRTLEKTTGGLGIGLSLVKGVVEAHGGTVEAKSEGEGRGSEFVIRLPITIAENATAAASAEPLAARASNVRRVLVVDDNVDAADLLAQLLEMLGTEVRTAYDGEAGVEAARAFCPDLVLCDIGMPKLNGYDFARRIRAEEWGKKIILVAVTGWGQQDDRKKSADAGFDHHVVKPVEAGVLASLLGGLPAAPK